MEVMTVNLTRDKTDVDVIGSGSFVGVPENVGVHLDEIGLGSVPIMNSRHEMIHFGIVGRLDGLNMALSVDTLNKFQSNQRKTGKCLRNKETMMVMKVSRMQDTFVQGPEISQRYTKRIRTCVVGMADRLQMREGTETVNA
jgi:hypothetical protein